MTVNGDHPGDTTRDLRNTGPFQPTDDQIHEQRTQRRGNRYLAAGFVVIALTVILSLSVSIAYNDQPFPNPEAKIFANLVFVTLMVSGAMLGAVGLIERLLRSNRARQMASAAAAHERGEQVLLTLQRHVLDTQERDRELMAHVMAVPHQMSALIERVVALERAVADVPNYGRGVIDGVQMRQEALGDVEGFNHD